MADLLRRSAARPVELREARRALLPCAVTAAGLVSGLLGLAWLSWPLLVLSVACDVADGWIARRWAAVSRTGAELDWHTDVALAHAAVWVAFPAPIAAPISLTLVLVQVGARVGSLDRVSGRAAVFAAVVFLWCLHG